MIRKSMTIMKSTIVFFATVLFSAVANSAIGPQPIVPTPLGNATHFVAHNGSGTACTEPSPCALQTAINQSGPGDVVFLRGGTYMVANVTFSKSGTSENPIIYESYPGELAILDGSNYSPPQWRQIEISGNFVQVRGIEVRNMVSRGIFITGADNIVEGCEIHNNLLSGVQVWAADGTGETKASRNIIRHNTIHDNSGADYLEKPYNLGGNTDGVGLSWGYDNRVENNHIYHNSDDGVDTWRSQRSYVGYNIVHSNGIGTNGEGHGIKAGGNPPSCCTWAEYNLSYSNKRNGLDVNDGVNVTFYRNTTWNNNSSFKLDSNPTVTENIGPEVKRFFSGNETNNSWQRAGTVTFISTDPNSPDFLKPTVGGGFEDIGAYATTTPPGLTITHTGYNN